MPRKSVIFAERTERISVENVMRPIFLIGFMGSGKTTLAKALSRATGLEYIDLDAYIEARFHANVSEIFAREGQARFRDMERRMLREVAEFEDVIVACGGGTPCWFDNMEFMNSRGLTVRLDASHPRLLERLKKGRHRRPLIRDLDDEALGAYIAAELERRNPWYSRAVATFCADRLDSLPQIQQSVKEFTTLFNIPCKS